jgi:hypothetical protein
MVNVRHALELAESQGLIASQTHRALVDETKRLFYPDRSWPAVFDAARRRAIEASEIDRLRAFVAREQPDLKRDDARRVLEAAAQPRDPSSPRLPALELADTLFWQNLVRSFESGHEEENDEGLISSEELLRHVRLSIHRTEWIRGTSLMTWFLDAPPEPLSSEELERGLEEFRRERALLSGEATEQWLEDNHVSDEELDSMIRYDLHVRRAFEGRDRASQARALVLELKRRGVYGELVKRLQERRRVLAERGLDAPSAEQMGTSLEAALDWYVSEVRTFSGSLEDHGLELGFATVNDFLIEMLSELAVADPGSAGGALS